MIVQSVERFDLRYLWTNDYAVFSLIGGGLCKAKEAIWQRILLQRLSSPFLVASDGFAKIGKDFRDKFSSGVVNDRFHHSNDNMLENVCQTHFSRVFTSNLASFRAFAA